MSVAGSVEVPDGLIRRIAERFSPDKIILFGSCARGDAGPERDIDLLVLFPDVASPNKRAAELACGFSAPHRYRRFDHLTLRTLPKCGKHCLLASRARRQISL